jgi:hypothetical protein
MVQLHIDDSAINPFDGGGVTNSTLHTVGATCGVAAMDATQANLINHHGVLAARSGGVDIAFGGRKNLDILVENIKKCQEDQA